MAAERVLVVDDSHTQRVILDAILTKAGYDVICARDGHEALDELDDQLFIGEGKFSFLIMDIAMPRLDGYGLIRKLAERKRAAPAIIMMSERDRAIIDTAVELANGYGLQLMGAVAKPVREGELLGLMRQLVLVKADKKHDQLTCLTDASFLEGLTKNALTVSYQPKISCWDGRLEGAECLARWRTSKGGILSPATFLPVARKNGYLSGITHKVLMQAMADLIAWRRQGIKIGVAVNITASDVSDLSFADFIHDLLMEYQISPDLLTLELTESEFVEDMAIAMEVLGRLRLLGVRLALDDFGAGFDPLLRLNSMPFTELKSDQPFLQNAEVNTRSRVILEMSIDMARRLAIASTCEGIETADQWRRVCSLGATYGQGYFISPPLLQEDFVKWAKNWHPDEIIPEEQFREARSAASAGPDHTQSSGRAQSSGKVQSSGKAQSSPEGRPAAYSQRRTDLL